MSCRGTSSCDNVCTTSWTYTLQTLRWIFSTGELCVYDSKLNYYTLPFMVWGNLIILLPTPTTPFSSFNWILPILRHLPCLVFLPLPTQAPPLSICLVTSFSSAKIWPGHVIYPCICSSSPRPFPEADSSATTAFLTHWRHSAMIAEWMNGIVL